MSSQLTWTGSDFLLRSQGFSSGALVSINGVNVGGRTVDDSTAAIPMPAVAGPALLAVEGPAIERAEFELDVYGYVGTVPAPPMGIVLPWPAWPNSSQFVSGPTTGNIVRVAAATGQQLDIHPGEACYRGLGPSHRADVFTLCHSPQGVRAVTLAFTVTDSAAHTPARLAALLGPGRWLFAEHHFQFSLANGVQTFEYSEENHRVIMSPRGDRTLALFNVNNQGVAVWDNATATVAYHVPLLHELDAATFGNGDTLYLIGLEQYNVGTLGHVLMVDATSGVILRDRPVAYNSLWPVDAVLSGDGRYLLVLKIVGDPAPRIDVFDAATLDSVGVMLAPAGALPTGWFARMALNREDLYVTSATYTTPAAIVHFKLPPLRP